MRPDHCGDAPCGPSTCTPAGRSKRRSGADSAVVTNTPPPSLVTGALGAGFAATSAAPSSGRRRPRPPCRCRESCHVIRAVRRCPVRRSRCGRAGGAGLSRWGGTAARRSPARIPARRAGTGSGSRATVAWSRSPNTTHLWVCLTVRVGPMGKHRSLRPTVIRRRQRGVAAIAVVGGAAAALAAVRHPRCRHRAAFGAQPMRPADRVTGLSTACTVSLAVLRRHRDFGLSTDWALGLAVCAWCSKGSLCLPAWASARACSTRWG